MQISILSGIYTDQDSNFRSYYPCNYVPVAKQQGISNGYLKPADGIVKLGDGTGIDRGGISWKGHCYRVMGTKLVKVYEDGSITTIGEVGGNDQVTFDYSFDYLGVVSDKKLFLYNGTTLTQVTDSDLGQVLDFVWVDGYFMTTDGEFLVVTDLNNPFAVNPLKYGSSEADPDDVKAVLCCLHGFYSLFGWWTK